MAGHDPGAVGTQALFFAADDMNTPMALDRVAQNLEKSGKTAAALTNYRQVVRLYPDTPSARTAADRIKALGPR